MVTTGARLGTPSAPGYQGGWLTRRSQALNLGELEHSGAHNVWKVLRLGPTGHDSTQRGRGATKKEQEVQSRRGEGRASCPVTRSGSFPALASLAYCVTLGKFLNL